MFSTLTRTCKRWFAYLITAILLFFAMVNREFIDLSFFPFPYEIALPKFLLVIIAFALGLIVGGLFMSSRISQAKRDYKKEHKRVAALENEVRAIHTQKNALPD